MVITEDQYNINGDKLAWPQNQQNITVARMSLLEGWLMYIRELLHAYQAQPHLFGNRRIEVKSELSLFIILKRLLDQRLQMA